MEYGALEGGWSSLADEEFRTYVYDGYTVQVAGEALNVSPSGGHRIVGRDGYAYYVPAGWRYLWWKPAANAKSYFQF